MQGDVKTGRSPDGRGAAATDKRRNVEAIFPLRAEQRPFMLYTAQEGSAAAASDPGFIQVRFELVGAIEDDVLRRAWQLVVDRHASLRMSARSAAGKEPLLVVWKQVSAPWSYTDWRDDSDAEQTTRLAAMLAEDRRRGLDVSTEPVSRLTVIRLGDERHTLVWSCHHLFVDGWSSAIVVRDLLDAYRMLVTGGTGALPPLVSDYRDYLDWRKSRDRDALKSFWTNYLSGVVPMPATRLPGAVPNKTHGPGDHGRFSMALDHAASDSLKAVCASHGVTPNALIQGAWALMLGAISNRSDVMFGTTVSGRPADLRGIESLVGMFANNLPVRICTQSALPVRDWLCQIRDQQMELALHADSDTADIQSWNDLPVGTALFDTLLVVENFPWASSDDGQAVQVAGYHSNVVSAQSLTLLVLPELPWTITFDFDRSRFAVSSIDVLTGAMAALLTHAAENIEAPLTTVEAWLKKRLDGAFETDAGSVRSSPPQAGSEGLAVDEASYEAPKTQAQLQLTAIWEDVLGVAPIGITDDFFAIGGKSLAAVRVFALIEERLNKRLPLSVLPERPTIARLAELIDQDAAPRWTSLVALQASGRKPPLFCAHAGGEHALYYRHLAQQLGRQQPVFALEPPGLNGEAEPLRSIYELATHYVDELRTVQPQGPYWLLGYCVGATVCLEMARKLEHEGDRVAHLIVLDSGFWWGGEPSLIDRERKPQTAGLGAKIKEKWRQGGSADLFKLIGRNVVFLLSRYRDEIRKRLTLKFGSAERRRAVWGESVEDACHLAFKQYQPTPCKARATLVRTTEYLGIEEKQRHLKWRDQVSALDVRVVDGEHDTMLEEPTVAQVATVVSECCAGNGEGNA